MKTLSIVIVAILLGLSGAALAGDNDNQNSQQSYTNATGPNPFMPEFSTPASSGRSAFARYPRVLHRAEK